MKHLAHFRRLALVSAFLCAAVPAAAGDQVRLEDHAEVVVTSALDDNGNLILLVSAQQIGTVHDTFCADHQPPRRMTLKILDLPDGSQLTAEWRGEGRSGSFARGRGFAYATFPVPAAGARSSSYFFEAAVPVKDLSYDPVLKLSQVDNCTGR
jgi:hypothetical protein